MRPARVIILALTFALAAAAQAQVDWESWDAAVIRTTRTTPIQLDVQTSPAAGVATARLDLAAGGSVTLAAVGNGRFTGTITPAQALAGYDAADVNRNFVGFLRLLGSGGQPISTVNEFINVIDGSIPAAPVKARSSTARQTSRIFNVVRSPMSDLTSAAQDAVRQFYTYFPDDFDFVLVVFSMPSFPANRYHIGVRADATGTGQSPNNATASYGSAGRLLGVTVYPLDFLFDGAETSFSHETGHQWINFLANPRLSAGRPHWPPSNLASGVMGFSIPGSGAGGDFAYTVEAAGPGLAHVRSRTSTEPRTFTDLDLYLMGLLPPSQVQNAIVLDGDPCADCMVPATTITIQDVINANGPRIPTSSASQKSFRVATIVVTRNRLLNDDELAFFDSFAARGESRVALPFTSGLARGTTYPFSLATRGLATVDFHLTNEPVSTKKRAVRH